jgi:hypothetical protein
MEPRAPSILGLIRLAIAARSWSALVRAVQIWLGIRRPTPQPGEVLPAAAQGGAGDAGDTGGGWYRPAHRKQDPAADPREPGGGESSSRGNDHGWANCTMASGAMTLDFDTLGDRELWGGDLRHKQGDLEGGTDLNDLREAWAAYGRTLTIRSGAGWEALKDDRAAGRFLVVQGEGNVPGSATFDGGHACCLGPETNADGNWLWGDPLAGGWQWAKPGEIKAWMERWSSGLAWARSAAHPPATPPPDPDPDPAPPPPAVDKTPFDQADVDRAVAAGLVSAGDAAVRAWVAWLGSPAPGPGDVWDTAGWSDPLARVEAALAGEDDPCGPDPAAGGRWARGPVLAPVWDAYGVLTADPAWDRAAWRQAGWA